jgi:hypothetical protein
MSEPRVSISSRRSQDSHRSGPVSHGRGGAGNIGISPNTIAKKESDLQDKPMMILNMLMEDYMPGKLRVQMEKGIVVVVEVLEISQALRQMGSPMFPIDEIVSMRKV